MDPSQPVDDDLLAQLIEYAKVDTAGEPSRQAYAKFLQEKSAAELRWWSKDTVAVVTGSNKGIGLEIVRQLATQGITTILTARDEVKGMAALGALKGEGLENVLFHTMDVTNPDSVAKCAIWIKDKFGGLDILVGNAAFGSMILNDETLKTTFDTNYYGQKTVVSALLPLLKPSQAGARIVFLSSDGGQIKLLKSEKLRQKLHDIDNLTMEEVDSLASKYFEDVKAGRQTEVWTNRIGHRYNESKCLMNAYGRLLAKSLSSRNVGSKVYVNLMTPGFTSTDLTANHPAGRPVKEGADTAVWLALMPSGGPSGGFFRDRADFAF